MKILYVTTISNTINAFLVPHIKLLVDQGHQVDVACNIMGEVNSQLRERGCHIYNIEFQRSPLKKENFIAYKKINRLVKQERYELVHVHTPVASFLTRLATIRVRKNRPKIMYTAHGFHFYKGAPLQNWILYYPVERFLAKHTDVLITINKEDFGRASKSFRAGSVEYIPGVGIDVDKFSNAEIDTITKRKSINIPGNAFVALSVGELNKNKNHEVVIRALAKLNNPRIHYVICGQGTLESYLKGLIKELNLEKRVHLLGFRTDVAEIYKASDIFIFPSFREGLPVSLMEAMASGLPVICSNIRGNSDLIEEGSGGYLVNPNSVTEIAHAINKVLKDKDIQCNMGQVNSEKSKLYSVETIKDQMIKIYGEGLTNEKRGKYK